MCSGLAENLRIPSLARWRLWVISIKACHTLLGYGVTEAKPLCMCPGSQRLEKDVHSCAGQAQVSHGSALGHLMNKSGRVAHVSWDPGIVSACLSVGEAASLGTA